VRRGFVRADMAARAASSSAALQAEIVLGTGSAAMAGCWMVLSSAGTCTTVFPSGLAAITALTTFCGGVCSSSDAALSASSRAASCSARQTIGAPAAAAVSIATSADCWISASKLRRSAPLNDMEHLNCVRTRSTWRNRSTAHSEKGARRKELFVEKFERRGRRRACAEGACKRGRGSRTRVEMAPRLRSSLPFCTTQAHYRMLAARASTKGEWSRTSVCSALDTAEAHRRAGTTTRGARTSHSTLESRLSHESRSGEQGLRTRRGLP
jgi:hypothetical protein